MEVGCKQRDIIMIQFAKPFNVVTHITQMSKTPSTCRVAASPTKIDLCKSKIYIGNHINNFLLYGFTFTFPGGIYVCSRLMPYSVL